MWNNKNFRLSVILIILIIVTGIQLGRKGSSTSSRLDTQRFTIRDTLDIREIKILVGDENMELKNRDGLWYIGEKKADEYYISLLKAVLASIRVQRKISPAEKEEVNRLFESGARVMIRFDNDGEKTFHVTGNDTQTRSYIRDPETNDQFVVNIPGYQSFVAGIFFLSPLEWEDKTLFETPWTALRDLSVKYPKHPEWNFNIVPGDRLLTLEGTGQPDTTRIMDYAVIFSDLKANYFFSSQELDSLRDRPVFMEIEIRDLDESRNNRIQIFELSPGTNIQFGVDSNGQYFGLDYRNVNLLAVKKEDLETIGTP
jgi:hypothetical protein